MRAVGAATFWMSDRPFSEGLSVRRAPLLWAALAFAAGRALALNFSFTMSFTLAVGALGVVSCFALRRTPRVVMVPVLALWAVAGAWCAQVQPTAAPQTGLLRYADGLSREMSGRVLRVRALPLRAMPTAAAGEAVQPWRVEPGEWEAPHGEPSYSVDVAVDQMEDVTPDAAMMQPVSGGVRLTVLDGGAALRCGDAVSLPVRLRVPERYRDPGAWSYADWLLAQGISATASVKSGAMVSRSAGAASWHCRLFAAQSWASGRMQGLVASAANRRLPRTFALNDDDGAMVSAMLVGDRTSLRHDVRLGFERTGTFHLFVVSGVHVAIVAGVWLWVFRRLRMGPLPAALCTVAMTGAFAALTGFGTPAQRALLMTGSFLLARAIRRSMAGMQALGVAALVVLSVDPRALGDASFQMTFLALVAVVGIALPLSDRWLKPWIGVFDDLASRRMDVFLHPRLAQVRVATRMVLEPLQRRLRWLPRAAVPMAMRVALRFAQLCVVALVTEACMALPMAVFFHRATPFALPANVFLLPLVGVLMPLALLTFAAALCSATLAVWPGAVLAFLLHAIAAGIRALAQAQGADVRVPGPGTAALVVALVMLAAACVLVRRRRVAVVWAGVAALAVVPVCALWPAQPLLHAGQMEITAIDVGQGDSLFVASPDGHTALVDAGGPVGAPASADRWDVGKEVVAPFLWSRRVRRLDAVVLTHAHSDHMGGMPAVLRDFRPRELWLSVDPEDSPDLRALLELAQSLGVTIRHLHADDAFAWGGLRARVLSPAAGYAAVGAPRNDDSLVMRLEFGQASALLEGDAERPSEDAMVAAGRVDPVTFLKVGHHGSRTSTNPEFLAAARPQEAVISVGAQNTFGHPRGEVLQRLEDSGVKTWRTDRAGAVTFLFKADGSVTAVPYAPVRSLP